MWGNNEISMLKILERKKRLLMLYVTETQNSLLCTCNSIHTKCTQWTYKLCTDACHETIFATNTCKLQGYIILRNKVGHNIKPITYGVMSNWCMTHFKNLTIKTNTSTIICLPIHKIPNVLIKTIYYSYIIHLYY